jgi:DnaJ domain
MTSTETRDFYDLLCIPRDATTRQVRAAYRKLAKVHHPDKNPGDPDAAARFRDITGACNVLSDPGLREAYDRDHPAPPGTTITAPADVPAASRLLAVLEGAWRQIRRNHPEVPPVVLIIASGTDTRHPKWGHHAPGRWHHANDDHAEVMISGEGLRREPRDVLATLLHEAAHALAAARGITDTSRQGRYHNKKFAALASELGLDVTDDESGQYGWTITTVPDATANRYGDQLDALAFAMTLWRIDEQLTPRAKRNTNLIAASCPCGRRIRVAASTLAEAPITCQACDGSFEPDNAPDA